MMMVFEPAKCTCRSGTPERVDGHMHGCGAIRPRTAQETRSDSEAAARSDSDAGRVQWYATGTESALDDGPS